MTTSTNVKKAYLKVKTKQEIRAENGKKMMVKEREERRKWRTGGREERMKEGREGGQRGNLSVFLDPVFIEARCISGILYNVSQ